MIILLDEQLDAPDMRVARSLDVLGAPYGCSFRSLRTESPGLKDLLIPDYCRANEIDALVSANLRDFGAKRALYVALMQAGISVIVLRPQGKKSLRVEEQVSVLSRHLPRVSQELADAGSDSILLRVNESGCIRRSLEELQREVAGEGRLP